MSNFTSLLIQISPSVGTGVGTGVLVGTGVSVGAGVAVGTGVLVGSGAAVGVGAAFAVIWIVTGADSIHLPELVFAETLTVIDPEAFPLIVSLLLV